MKTKNNDLLEDILKSSLVNSLQKYELDEESNSLGDLYIYFDEENQSLIFYDDLENILLQTNLNDKGVIFKNDPIQEIKVSAHRLLKQLEKEGFFNKEFIFKPFSISLIDEDFVVLDEFIFIDDDTLKLEGDLWNNMDKELDEFFNNLMK